MKKKEIKAAPKSKTEVVEQNSNLKMVQIVCTILGLFALSFMIIENTRSRPMVQDNQIIQDYEKKKTDLQMLVNQKELEIIDLKQQVNRLTNDLNFVRKKVSELENTRYSSKAQVVKTPPPKNTVKKPVVKKKLTSPKKRAQTKPPKKTNNKKIVKTLPKKKSPPIPKRVIVDFTSEVPN